MRSTPPDPPIPKRSGQTLLEDLGVALRDVVVKADPADLKAVLLIDAELERRRVDTSEMLGRLSRETGWMMEDLLEQCRRGLEGWPDVRLLNGLRKSLLCFGCGEHERPEDPTTFLLCDRCLRGMLKAVQTRTPTRGMFVYRTYSADGRCQHADDETVLILYPWWEAEAGVCAECLEAEVGRRMTG